MRKGKDPKPHPDPYRRGDRPAGTLGIYVLSGLLCCKLVCSSLLVSGREEKILEEVEGVEQVKDYVTHTAENSYLCNICGKGRAWQTQSID
jgi:hypothetical protein